MSLMKRFAEDSEELTRRATEAAWAPTARLRKKALDQVYMDCGTAAKVYADPSRVTKMLIEKSAEAYMSQRKTRVYQIAG